jgi:hypothetical protein
MKTLLLLICAAVGADPGPLEVRAPKEAGNPTTPLHFGVNSEFYRPGMFFGTLPAADPRSKAEAFAAALRASGIRVLRLPAGDDCYYYLPESEAATVELAHSSGFWEFDPKNPASGGFSTLENLAGFARSHGIDLIYQLPMLFHLDHGRPRAGIQSAFSKQAKNFDHDRIDAQAEYAAGIVKRLRDLKAPVVAWELGNEEWAHCGGADFGRVAAAIVRHIRRQDAQTPIIAIGMDSKEINGTWLTNCINELRRQGVLEQIQSFNVHYPFGTWPGPATPADRANLSQFVQGDLQITRWFDPATKQRNELKIPGAPMALTETTVFKFDDAYWDPYRVIGTHAHALVYTWNWMTVLADPRCNAAVFHDLETTFFGMMRYNVGYDEAAKQFVQLSAAKPDAKLRRFPGQYVLSPTSEANRLLSSLVGYRVGLAALQPNDPSTRVLWGTDPSGRIAMVAVRRSPEGRTLSVPGLTIESAESLTADDLNAALPGQHRVARLNVRPDRPGQVELPPWSVTLVRIRPEGNVKK